MIEQKYITVPAVKRGFHLITPLITKELGKLPEKGLMNVFIKHTSAGLSINENYDPSVRLDMETISDRLIPDGASNYVHDMEGDDDMPAHFKSSMFGCSLTIPISGGKLALGTWQGIYLCEFRNSGGSRQIIVTIYS
jgi:secondary thiamine-phosphate synthase enzyme